MSLWRLSKDGAFERADGGIDFPLEAPCFELAPCAAHRDGSPLLIVSGPAVPLSLSFSKAGKWIGKDLPALSETDKPPPALGACVIGDLDGDGRWDVLQPGESSSHLWRGSGEGLTGPATVALSNGANDAKDGAERRTPSSAHHWALGDFDQDGFPDLFLTGEKGGALWENDGKGSFRKVTHAAGSLSYKLPAGVADCLATDLNHDGRTDLCLLYAQSTMLYHFNRGFRCFGEEGELRLIEGELGQSSGAVADFNGDGSLDLVVALADGRLLCYYNRAFERALLRLLLEPGLPAPITVSVWPEEKNSRVSLGVYQVFSSPMHTLVTLGDNSSCVLKWRIRGGPEQAKVVRLPPDSPVGGFAVTIGR